MKSSLPKRRIRPLHAKAATADFDDYGPEPNMKLSHAFLVVLALHVIAVGGLFAFNKVKAHHSLSSVKIRTDNALEPSAQAASETMPLTAQKIEKSVASISASTAAAPLHVAISPAPTAAVPVVPAPNIPTSSLGGPATPPPTPSTPVVPSAMAPQSAETPSPSTEAAPAAAVAEYTVVKGDNPYNIAKRFHVSYDSLMKLNNITDPRKIQIGQKLQIPAPLPAAAHKASVSSSHQASPMGHHQVMKKKAKKKS